MSLTLPPTPRYVDSESMNTKHLPMQKVPQRQNKITCFHARIFLLTIALSSDVSQLITLINLERNGWFVKALSESEAAQAWANDYDRVHFEESVLSSDRINLDTFLSQEDVDTRRSCGWRIHAESDHSHPQFSHRAFFPRSPRTLTPCRTTSTRQLGIQPYHILSAKSSVQ